MIKYCLILYMMFMSISNFGQESKISFIKDHYCFENKEGGVVMDIIFKKKYKYVYILYACALGDGKYLNAYADTLDYAARIEADRIKEHFNVFKVKSYYDKGEFFLVKISFSNRGNNMKWSISSKKFTPYLPKNADFTYCKIK